MNKKLKQVFVKFNSYRNLQGRFFAYFIIATFLVMGLVGSLLYYKSSDALKKETIQSEQNILTGLYKSTEIMLNQVENSMGQVVTTPDITDIPKYFDTNNVEEMIRMNNDMNRIKVQNDYIYNIAIYYVNEKKVYEINNGIYKLEDYLYKKLISEVCKFPVSMKKAPLSRITDVINNGKTLNVVSIVKPIPINGSEPIAYVVVNIEEGYFRSIINSLIEKNGVEIYITNKAGEIITSNSHSRKYESLINNDSLRQFSSLQPDYRIGSINGEKTLISVVTSKDYEWKYISIIPYSSIVSKLQFIKNYTMVVFLIALILSLLLSIALSNKMSGPIRSIAELLRNSGSENDDKNIYRYIEKNINTLVEKNATFEKNMSDYMPVLRNNYVTNILMGYVPEPGELKSRFEYYGVNFNFNFYHIVCIIPLDNYRELSEKYTEHQMNMLTVYLIEVLNQFVNHDNKGLVISTRPDEIAIILEIPVIEDISTVREMVEEICMEMQKTILKNIRYTAAVGIGSICTDFSEISDSYDEALQAMRYKLLKGNSGIIFYEDIKSMLDEDFSYPFELEKELFNLLSKGDVPGVLEKNREILKQLTVGSGETGDSFYYYMQLLNSVVRYTFELGINIESVSQENGLYKDILKCRNAFEIQQWFEQVYITICRIVENNKGSKAQNVVHELEEYIRNNFEKDLSLNALAAQVYISVAYMRRLFKENTGKSIKQYINEVRLEKAKEFLRDPQYKVVEVAEMVGYDKIHAFIYFFKENTGMTPGEYREQVQKLI